VWKIIRRIQREFLWGGRGGRKQINWVKWDVVCQPRSCGGLGVRDIRAVNISLLSKWRWRLLKDDHSLWKDVIREKYGNAVIGKVDLGEECKPWFSSSWWRDICSIGTNLDHNWFSEHVVRKMGNGEQTSFWEDIWVGEVSLRDHFPRLFSISMQKEASVASLRNLNDAVVWNFIWRRRLFVWEVTLLDELLLILNPITLSSVTDCWGWRPEKGEEFTVRSTYGLVLNLIIPRDAMPNEERLAFKAIWKGPTPSKVSGFAWMLLHDRVPTRVNLYKCRIIQEDGDQRCVFCGQCAETVTHLFLYCSGITQVWHRVCAWLGLHFLLPHSISSLLNFFATTPGCKQLRQGLVDEVKIASWKWWIGKSKASPCLFYEWNVEPEICLKR
ncbi:ribonuclease H, partial [Trifolium pratense]